jgi:hypothetical protein
VPCQPTGKSVIQLDTPRHLGGDPKVTVAPGSAGSGGNLSEEQALGHAAGEIHLDRRICD